MKIITETVSPGMKFAGVINGVMVEVVKVDKGVVFVREEKTGEHFAYGLEMFRQLMLERIK